MGMGSISGTMRFHHLRVEGEEVVISVYVGWESYINGNGEQRGSEIYDDFRVPFATILAWAEEVKKAQAAMEAAKK
jgi:hypothetical protein